MNFISLHSKVAVLPDVKEEKTPSGIYLPDDAQKKAQAGTVMAVGPGRVLDNGNRAEMPVKVGDRVYFSKYGGNEMKLDGVDYVLLDDDQIYGIFPAGVEIQ
jgi:chaperonin GroES